MRQKWGKKLKKNWTGRGASEAATITVNTTVPGIATDGKCSLIEAIINANDNAATHSDCLVASDPDPPEDHIILPNNQKIILTTPFPGSGSYGPTGLSLITSAITIEGNGAKIMRKKMGAPFRLLSVTNTGDLELQNLTLSRGRSTYAGGAIINAGQLTITDSTITGNTGPIGGAIANYHELTITNSTISKNTAKGSFANLSFNGGYGGGIANDTTGTLTISNSTVTMNKAYIGGAIINGGNFSISGSEISKNTALAGAGIANYSGSAPTHTIANSTISGNIAKLKTFKANGLIYLIGGIGGALLNYQSLITVTNSAISGNSAKGKKFRGSIFGGAGGGIANGISSVANLTLTGGSVTGNSASYLWGAA
ncbi:MAG: right-handed parallel beta-helix repeat-containing protein [bacterium]|nr:right-handed parallel beta-helix repeat-containing protein [bacterium]